MENFAIIINFGDNDYWRIIRDICCLWINNFNDTKAELEDMINCDFQVDDTGFLKADYEMFENLEKHSVNQMVIEDIKRSKKISNQDSLNKMNQYVCNRMYDMISTCSVKTFFINKFIGLQISEWMASNYKFDTNDAMINEVNRLIYYLLEREDIVHIDSISKIDEYLNNICSVEDDGRLWNNSEIAVIKYENGNFTYNIY